MLQKGIAIRHKIVEEEEEEEEELHRFPSRSMSPKKCVFGCEGKVTLFSFPTNPALRKLWIQFAFAGQKRNYAHVFVCSRHFSDDCFSNKAQFDAGFADRLRLNEGAVPGIREPEPEPDIKPSTSADVVIKQEPPSFIDAECQTEPRSTVSVHVQANPLKTSVGVQCTFAPSQKTVGTQFSFTKQTGHVRNKVTQTSVLSKSVSTETTEIETWRHQSSTSVKASTSRLRPRPAKRPRMEEENEEEEEIEEGKENGSAAEQEEQREVAVEEEEEEEEEEEVDHDSTYVPTDSLSIASETSGMEDCCDYTDAKYIVFESSLRELFETCPICKHNCNVQRRRLGSFVSFRQFCDDCRYTKLWQSQPVRGSTPVGNLQMSAAVYFTGGSFSQLDKICRAMHLQIHQYSTFRRHAVMFLEPSIYHKWKMDQQAMFQQLQTKGKIALSGNMRAHSPGQPADYCSYSLMHLESNKILDIQLVQSSEDDGNAHMEREGLRKALDLIESNQLHVDYIVTDRHPQVRKCLKERAIKQYYDICHLEKGLSKKLEKLSRKKDCQVLRKWLLSIKNHMLWSVMSSNDGPEKVAKWKSLVNHIQNVHTHDDPLFPKCSHPDRVTRDPSKWLKPGTMVLYKVEKLLLNKRVLRDVKKLSYHQASALKALHSVIPRFVPKNVPFPFVGMLCRLYLAAMHVNEKAHSEQAITSEDTTINRTMNPKPKKGHPRAKTCGYISDLMRLLFTEVFNDSTTFVEELRKVVSPDEFDSSAREDVIGGPVATFSPAVVESQCSSNQHQETPDETEGQDIMTSSAET